MGDKIFEGKNIISSKNPEPLLTRNLSVGFFHALGGREEFTKSYRESDYKTKAHNLFDGGGGTASWLPRSIKGPSKMVAQGIQGLGGADDEVDRNLNLGGAANWSDSLGAEDIKKDILPTVAWHSRGNLSELHKTPGTLGFGTSNPAQRAKSYVWKQLNKTTQGVKFNAESGFFEQKQEGAGWGANEVPRRDSWGFSGDYLKLIRKKGKFQDNAQAGSLLSSFIGGATDDVAEQVVFGDFTTDSAEEAALRLWPYIKDSVPTSGPLAGTLSAEDLQRGVNELLRTGGEGRTTTYDIQHSMAIWDDINESLQRAGVDSSFELKHWVEVTQQEQRIAKQVEKNLDLSDKDNRYLLRRHMEQEIDVAVTQAVKLGRSRTYAEDDTFAGEATRRMEEVFDWRALNHTWIEPVQGGIGLYNVHIPAQMLGMDEAVPSTVSITFLPFPLNLTGLVTGISSKAGVERLLNKTTAGRIGAVFEYAGVDYTARFRTGLGMYQHGFQGGYTPYIRTRGVVMTQDELTNSVYNFITGVSLEMVEGKGKAAQRHKGPFTHRFGVWAQGAVSQIATYGQTQAEKLLDGSYKDWVKNPLTHGVGKDGAPREYGKKGSADKFTERLKGTRLYQPKPFMWLRSSGVKRHALYKAGADLTGGPIGS